MAIDQTIVLAAVELALDNIKERVDGFFLRPRGITAEHVAEIQSIAAAGIILGLAKGTLYATGTVERSAQNDPVIARALRSYRGLKLSGQATDERASEIALIDAQIMEFENTT